MEDGSPRFLGDTHEIEAKPSTPGACVNGVGNVLLLAASRMGKSVVWRSVDCRNFGKALHKS